MDMLESTMLTIERTAEAFSYFGAVVFMLFIGKFVYNKTTSFDFDNELTDRDNKAFAVALAGYIGGLALALSGTLYATGNGIYWDWIGIGITGLIAIVFMRLSVFVNDKLILYKFDNAKEIVQDKNLGTGFVQGGSCIATGLVLAGALSANSVTFLDKIIDVGIYWAIGQALLVLGGLAFQLITSYDIHKILEDDDNAAAGLSFGAFLVAIGIVTNAALRGASSNIVAELPTIGIWAAMGFLLLVLMRIIVDKVLLPKSSLSHEIKNDRNVGAGAIAAVGFLSVALLFGTAVNPAPASKASNIFNAEDETISIVQPAEDATTKGPNSKPVIEVGTDSQEVIVAPKDSQISTPKVAE